MLYSEQMKGIIEKLGVDPAECKDGLYSTLLQTIYDACDGGGGGVTINNQNKTITENGTYTADNGYTGLGTVTVNVAASGGGGASVEDEIVCRSIAGKYANNRVANVGAYAFHSCTSLTAVDFPLATNVGVYAFYGCTSVAAVDFPLATNVGTYAFYGCTSVAAVDFPLATNVGAYAFYGCTSVASVDFPLATNIGNSAFYNCTALTAVDFPLVTKVGSSAFNGCTALTSVDFPVLPVIGSSAFNGCTSLGVVVLRYTKVCTIPGTTVFSKTPFASGYAGGKLLVPADLVDSYKNETNWTILYGYGTNKFLALEDYTVDGTTTGAIDWDKLNAA